MRPLVPLQAPPAVPDTPGTPLLQLYHCLRGCKVATPGLCDGRCFFPWPTTFLCFLSLLLWTGSCCNGAMKAMICELFSAAALQGDKETKAQAG